MTPKEQAAMQQALEALELFGTDDMAYIKSEKAITAMREALDHSGEANEMVAEQAEQEPVAWRVRGYNQFKTGNPAPWRYVDGADKPTVNKPDCCDFEPLYAAPVRTKDLTDDEIMKINVDTAGIVPTCDRQFHFASAVIAADRELNK